MVWEHSRFGSHVAEVVQDRCLTPPVHRMEEHRAEANLQMPLSRGGGEATGDCTQKPGWTQAGWVLPKPAVLPGVFIPSLWDTAIKRAPQELECP
jgi:hypothetical protein